MYILGVYTTGGANAQNDYGRKQSLYGGPVDPSIIHRKESLTYDLYPSRGTRHTENTRPDVVYYLPAAHWSIGHSTGRTYI